MTDTNEMKNQSINEIVVSKDGGQPVLLIALKSAYQSLPQYLRYLKREYEGARELQHENILKVNSLKEVDGYGTCIETEWQDARTLAEYLEEGHTADEKKRVVRGVAAALQYMHENGHVHGAVNTHDIYMTTKGDDVKLLSIRLRYTDNLKRSAEELKFVAPETKDGTVAIDARADIFSLGVLIKEMALGEGYQQVIETCTHFGRNERYTSVEEFMDAFEHPRATRTAENNRNTTGSNKQMAIIVAVIGILVIVAATLFYSQNDDKGTGTQASDTEMVDSTGNQAAQSAPDAAQTPRDTTGMSRQQNAGTDANAAGQYSGDNAYLNDIVPQMQIDLDKIYSSSTHASVVRRKVKRYYHGLRATLKDKSKEQLDAFDKAFADYNNSKK